MLSNIFFFEWFRFADLFELRIKTLAKKLVTKQRNKFEIRKATNNQHTIEQLRCSRTSWSIWAINRFHQREYVCVWWLEFDSTSNNNFFLCCCLSDFENKIKATKTPIHFATLIVTKACEVECVIEIISFRSWISCSSFHELKLPEIRDEIYCQLCKQVICVRLILRFRRSNRNFSFARDRRRAIRICKIAIEAVFVNLEFVLTLIWLPGKTTSKVCIRCSVG